MNIEQLEKGKKLVELIKTTKDGIKELKLLADKRNNEPINEKFDGQYRLTICEFKDGSGRKAELNRSLGNAKLLDIIIDTLEIQLKNFEQEFENL